MDQKQPNRIIQLLAQVWPYIYRGINSALYLIISVIKSFVSEAIKMIKTGGTG